ncbi:ABC transporter permease [Nocardioides yefusunii]|uniref:ABC transporter permease n=1 Tax=Nocardioides yefusunii TaxID=2500546 RepID=A0ABW1QW91_9ACTN|nr:ABC transporter permease [Nocardioides yefusunii]
MSTAVDAPEAVSAPSPSRRTAGRTGGRTTGLVVGKLLRLLSLLVATVVGIFVLLSYSPVDPVQAYVGADSAALSAEQKAQIAERWGLDDPPLERFGAWAGNLLQGDWGTSQVYGEPVLDVIGERFMASLALMALAWIFSGVLGFILGLVAGARQGRLTDRVLSWFAYTLASSPTFWVGLLLLYVFAVQLQWAPVCCAGPIGALPGEVSLLERLHHLVLPALTLSVVGVSPVLLHTRHATIEALASDQVSFARSQGEKLPGLVLHRVVRNAAAPALMLQFASVGELFGGAVLAEQVFTYPGLGEATTTAAMRQDVPLLMGISIITAVLIFVGNALGDVAHRAVAPQTKEVGA